LPRCPEYPHDGASINDEPATVEVFSMIKVILPYDLMIYLLDTHSNVFKYRERDNNKYKTNNIVSIYIVIC